MCCNRPRAKVVSGGGRSIGGAGVERPMGGKAAVSRGLPSPVFEYVGGTALTVVSPITRRIYRFEKTGTRVTVDVRDRSWVAFVPNVVRVS